jgi:hypothetical protein
VRPWSYAEQEALRILAPLGGRACALTFDRSLKSIHRKAAKIGVSMRPRTLGDKWGTTSPAVLRRVRELSDAMLCPECAVRFVGVATTGLCGMCHMRRLAEVHKEQIEQADAQRELYAARSKLYRRRRQFAKAEALSATETGDGSASMETEQFTDPGEATCTQ